MVNLLRPRKILRQESKFVKNMTTNNKTIKMQSEINFTNYLFQNRSK